MNFTGLISDGIVFLIFLSLLWMPIYTAMTTKPTCTELGIIKDIQLGSKPLLGSATNKIYLQNGEVIVTSDTIYYETDSIANKPLFKCDHVGNKYYQIEETK
jgi:hypothetical protein